MNYDEQQGVAYVVGKLYDLLDEHAKEEKNIKRRYKRFNRGIGK